MSSKFLRRHKISCSSAASGMNEERAFDLLAKLKEILGSGERAPNYRLYFAEKDLERAVYDFC
ncbi:hypothetical protein PI124_g10192 [Phytophthora idaei]|nr:hypothetical protein PI125_g9815 [Phytophthora idaei]KAG3172317.1 hypothetical protein PI126_g1415 [Phytophthora idaei]KAG3245055.1 hypothetical protein PI124_g10192 [Phytophthora idaei]